MTHNIPSPLIRKPEAQKLLQVSRSTLYKRINDGLLPAPIQIGQRAVAFVREELMTVITAQIAGFKDDEIRSLVNRLVSDRQNLLSER